MNAYLSVDLDYWSFHADHRPAIRFFEKVEALKVPITFVIEHEELIKDVKRMKDMRTLYNIDFHSDIVAQKEKGSTMQDYNWANFVPAKLRKTSEFVWMIPDATCYTEDRGICHGDDINPFEEPQKSGWQSCTIGNIKSIKWGNIKRVGVCLSPRFVSLKNVAPVIESLGVNMKRVKDLVRRQPESHKRRKRGVLKKIAA